MTELAAQISGLDTYDDILLKEIGNI